MTFSFKTICLPPSRALTSTIRPTVDLFSKDENGEFMRMFWLDATEENGTIYLIGKIAVPSPAGNGQTAYLSACVAVHGIEREVLVLPR